MTSACPAEPILRVRDLGVTYAGGAVALRATHLTLYRRQFTVLLGLSGAGKSTLLRCLNHLVVPSQGEVESVRHGSLRAPGALRAHRRATAMVFQHHHLIHRQTALQNVLMGRLGYHGFWRSLLPLPAVDLDIAAQALARVGLADKISCRVDQLSGGQRQRVGIARALAQRPALILADEPVASLDPATSAQVLTLLQSICREDGIAAVVSLHQLDYARQFADRIIGLAAGAVVFDAAPGALTEADLARIYRRADAPDAPPPRAADAAPTPRQHLHLPAEVQL